MTLRLSPDHRDTPATDHTVVFLTQDLGRGGAERVFVTLVNHLDEPRPVPVIVQSLTTMADELPGEQELCTLATRDGRTSARHPAARNRWRLLDRLDYVLGAQLISFFIKSLRLRKIVRSNRAVAISSFLPRAHVVAALTRELFARDVGLVMNVHCFMSQHLRHHFPPRLRPLARWVMRAALRRADAVFAVAETARQDLLETLDLDPQKVHVVPNPLHMTQIRSLANQPLDAADDWGRPVIVGIGRLTRLKGYHVLVEALAIVRQRLDAHVVLLGDGPERRGLEALAERLGVARALHLVGDQANPWRFLARADLMVHPSFTEAFPNVLGEAMALNVPVIASSCSPGISEYLEGGAVGMLVRPGDVQELAAAIESVLEDPTLRGQMIERGRARIAAFEVHRAVDFYREQLRLAVPRLQSICPQGSIADESDSRAAL